MTTQFVSGLASLAKKVKTSGFSLMVVAAAVATPLAVQAGPTVKTGGQRMGGHSHFIEITAEVQQNGHVVGNLHGFSHEALGFVATGHLELRDANGGLVRQIQLGSLGINGEFLFSSGNDRAMPFDYTLSPEEAGKVTSIVAVPVEGYNDPLDLIGDNLGKARHVGKMLRE